MTKVSGTVESPAMAGRQPLAAGHISRGVCRLLSNLGHASVIELPLPNGRRADVVALSAAGDLWIIEIKSSVEDLKADGKWPEYWDYCDRLFFAVSPSFPAEMLPSEAGIILADSHGGEVIRSSPEVKMAAARRKAMILRFGRTAAFRLQRTLDPAAVDQEFLG